MYPFPLQCPDLATAHRWEPAGRQCSPRPLPQPGAFSILFVFFDGVLLPLSFSPMWGAGEYSLSSVPRSRPLTLIVHRLWWIPVLNKMVRVKTHQKKKKKMNSYICSEHEGIWKEEWLLMEKERMMGSTEQRSQRGWKTVEMDASDIRKAWRIRT